MIEKLLDWILGLASKLPVSDGALIAIGLAALLVVVLVSGGFLLLKAYLFPNNSVNLQWLGEKRRRDKLEFINSYLRDFDVSEEQKALLLEQQESLAFEHVIGIRGTKKYMRKELRHLHANSKPMFTWKTIEAMYPHLKEQNFRLVRGPSRPDGIFAVASTIFGLLLLSLGVLLLFLFSPLIEQGTPLSIALPLTLGMAAFAIGFGFYTLSTAIPIIRIWQLGKLLPKKEEVQRNETASNSSQPHQNLSSTE